MTEYEHESKHVYSELLCAPSKLEYVVGLHIPHPIQ
jgi:hypothetical protein